MNASPVAGLIEVDEPTPELVAARCRFTGAEDVFRGHYPDFPILPGVFMIDMADQAMRRHLPRFAEPGTRLTDVGSVRFLSPVLPPEEVRVECAVKPNPAGGWKVSVRGSTSKGDVVRMRLGYAVPGAGIPAEDVAVPDAPAADALGTADIMALIPHRAPMLLLDAVSRLEPEELTARKAISRAEPWYAGLPADAPAEAFAYPTALMIESWCQAACVLAAHGAAGDEESGGRVALFGSISDVEVLGAAGPGDVLTHHARLVKALDDAWIFEGRTLTASGTPLLRVGTALTAMRPADVLAR